VIRNDNAPFFLGMVLMATAVVSGATAGVMEVTAAMAVASEGKTDTNNHLS
jgi:hypothetical protein